MDNNIFYCVFKRSTYFNVEKKSVKMALHYA